MIAFVSQQDKNITASQLTPLIREAACHSFVELERQVSVFLKFRGIDGTVYKIQGGIKNIDKTIRKITHKHNKRSKHFVEFLVISNSCHSINKNNKTILMTNGLDKGINNKTILASIELKQLRKFLKQNTVNKSFFYIDQYHPERLVFYPGNQNVYMSNAYVWTRTDNSIAGFFIGERISLTGWTNALTKGKKSNRIYVMDEQELDKHYLWFFNNEYCYRSKNKYGSQTSITLIEPPSVVPISCYKNGVSYSSKSVTCKLCSVFCTNVAFIDNERINICDKCLEKTVNKLFVQSTLVGKE